MAIRRYKAIGTGFQGGARRRPGDTFSADESFKASWAIQLEEEEVAPPRQRRQRREERIAQPDPEPDTGQESSDPLDGLA